MIPPAFRWRGRASLRTGAAALVLAAWAASSTAAAQTADSGRTASGLWYATQGRGPALVLVHGSNLDSRSFDWMVGPLARDHRTVVMDLRFHGRSHDAGGPVSWEGDLLEVMDAARVQRATLLGHSLGSQIVVDFALAHPERVERLILVGPAVSGYRPTAMPAGIEPMMQALRAGDVAGAAAALAVMPAMQLVAARERQPFVTQMFTDNAGLFRVDPARLAPVRPSATEQLERLAVPVLLLVGDSDLTEASRVAELVSGKVKGARVTRLPRCSHLAPIDCPDRVLREVERALRSATPP
jgi:3-oxoadipate enol-lactonase